MKPPQPSTASSRCGETMTTRSSSPGSGRPQLAHRERVVADAFRRRRIACSHARCRSGSSACAATRNSRVALVVDGAVRAVGREGLRRRGRCARGRRRRCGRARCPASSAAPRALARIGCSTWRISRSSTSAMIRHHSSDCAPPPMKCSHGNGRPVNFSTVAEQPAAVVRDAFEHRAHEVGARRLQREVVPARRAACGRRPACVRRSARA